MSSKIIVGTAAQEAATITWQRIGSPQTAPQSLAPSKAALSKGPADGPAGEKAPDVAALEAKLAKLQSEMAAREAQAKRAGFEEGEATARRNLEGTYKQTIANFAAQIGELAGLKKKLRREAEEDLVKLAIAIARRLIRRELSTDGVAILGLVKAALSRVEARDVIRIRVHPEDAKILQPCLVELSLPDRVELTADRSLERGAVIVETARGELDASVETQLTEIERGFADLVRRQS
jgi:flagellar assembly protein FliH